MAEQKKVLITGSNGLLGQAMVKIFRDDYFVIGCDLTGESFNTNYPENEYYHLDLTQRDKVQKGLSQLKPDIIINTAAFTDVDKSEEKRDLCWTTNVRSVEIMVEAVMDFSRATGSSFTSLRQGHGLLNGVRECRFQNPPGVVVAHVER